MPEDLGAVLDAPEVIADDAVNQVEDVTQTDVVDPSAVPEPKEEVAGDWRKVPAELKEFFKTPAGKAAKDAWFERNAYKEKFPEGIKQVNELTAFLDEHGGREGLTTALGELQGKAAELDAISEKIQNGDASLINDLPPETVAKLGPAMDAQWQKADPEGWTAHVSGVMAATIASNGVPMFLERLALNLEYGKLEEVKAQVANLKEWAGSFQTKAAAPKTNNVQPDKKFTEREQQLNQREQQAFNEDMDRQVESFRTPLISKELEAFTKRRPNDNDAKELATNTVKSQVIDRLKNDAGFQKSLNALWARKDKDGALRLIKSRETAAITEIAPKVGRTIFGNPGAAAVPVDKKPTGVPSKADVGFQFVDKAPKPESIDKFRTTDAMIMRGQFILKDGRKLTLES